jgi:uroporphyrinogen decarboxylase
MTHKERVRKAVHYEEVDRVPMCPYNTTIEYEMRMARHIGCNTLERMYTVLDFDIWRNRILPVYVGSETNELSKGQLWADCHSIDKVEEFPFPTYGDFYTDAMVRDLENHQGFCVITGTIAGGTTSGIWHLYMEMCGVENALVFIKEQPDIVLAMMRRITDYWVGYTRAVLDAGWKYIDIFQNANDLGTQISTIMSMADFRKLFKPSFKRLYDVAKEYGVMYMQHSCGAVEPLINDFIEMGADILNPIQVTAMGMDIDTIYKKYAGRIALFGGIDTTRLLPKGPVEKIREEVARVRALCPTGYILGPSQELKDDISIEHALSMFGYTDDN